jgi:hypothetical protein
MFYKNKRFKYFVILVNKRFAISRFASDKCIVLNRKRVSVSYHHHHRHRHRCWRLKRVPVATANHGRGHFLKNNMIRQHYVGFSMVFVRNDDFPWSRLRPCVSCSSVSYEYLNDTVVQRKQLFR